MFKQSDDRRRGRLLGSWKGRIAVGASVTAVAVVPALPAQAADEDPGRAEANIAVGTLGSDDVATFGHSMANSEDNPGPNRTEPVDFDVALSEYIDFGEAAGLLSESEASTPYDTRAVSGAAGADGSVSFDLNDGATFDPASIDLLSLFKEADLDGLTESFVDAATLELGVGGAEVVTEDGEFIDQDGVGGPGQYRVGQADLVLQSPLVEEAASMIYDALGRLDRVAEEQVNKFLELGPINDALPNGSKLDISVTSEMQDKIFKAILDEEITTKNHVLGVDFSTGTATVRLDQALHGDNDDGQPLRPGDPTGLNSQQPNTELIDDEIYPMIAETVHDLMEEVSSTAIGAIEGALGSITVDVSATLAPDPINSAAATWSLNLMGDELEPVTCEPAGPLGDVFCTTLVAAHTAVAPIVNEALIPARDFLVSDAGRHLFLVAVDGVKTGAITVPIRKAVEPALEAISKGVSLQVNSQRTETCEGSDELKSLDLSAFSIGLVRDANAGRIDLGHAGGSVRCD